MTELPSILSLIKVNLESLPDCSNLSDFIPEFYQFWQSLGCLVQQQLVQSRIEQIESRYSGVKKKKRKRYYTPLGEMVVQRRGYETLDGIEFLADKQLGLPSEKWLTPVLELACALGVNSEFPNAHKLFQKWTSIEITEKTLANQVEKIGNQLQELQLSASTSNYSEKTENTPQASDKIVYVGVDGVMTPLNQKQGYKEAKVGVVFWKKDHQKKNKRGVVRQKEYIATLKSREEFQEKIEQLYHQVCGEQTHSLVVIGDGAHWIWEMAEKQFPNSRQILDFYHLSEYVWKVGKAAYPKSEEQQKNWVHSQQKLLKKSQWKNVISNCQKIKKKKLDLIKAINDLERYLINNQNRIDYQKYLQLGLMIGSGVVESSNRRVVTQRLKQAGMHWSLKGAEGVMALRANYLSTSNRWLNFWQLQSCHCC